MTEDYREWSDDDLRSLSLYDSETGDFLGHEELGISEEQYHGLIRDSVRCGQWEGNIYPAILNGRRVYASE